MYYYNPLGDKMSQRLYVGALVALSTYVCYIMLLTTLSHLCMMQYANGPRTVQGYSCHHLAPALGMSRPYVALAATWR